MEIIYSLLGVYSPHPSDLEMAKKRAEDILGSSFLERSDLIELAKAANSVLLVEEEADDGDMEFMVVNNKGRVILHEVFSIDKSYEARDEVERVGAEVYFTKTMLKEIDNLAEEYELSRDEFIEDYLSAYYMDIYENKKRKYLENLKDYYKD